MICDNSVSVYLSYTLMICCPYVVVGCCRYDALLILHHVEQVACPVPLSITLTMLALDRKRANILTYTVLALNRKEQKF